MGQATRRVAAIAAAIAAFAALAARSGVPGRDLARQALAWRQGHVVGLDARGHGRGPKAGPWHTEQFVEDLAELVTSLDAGPAIMIGHSMGGLHAWVFAATYPQFVRAVVVEDIAPVGIVAEVSRNISWNRKRANRAASKGRPARKKPSWPNRPLRR